MCLLRLLLICIFIYLSDLSIAIPSMWIRLMGHQTMVLAADKPPPLVPSFAPENFGRRVVVQYHSCITVSPTFGSFSGGCGYVPLPKLSTLSPLYLHYTIIVVCQNQFFRGPIVQSPLIGKPLPVRPASSSEISEQCHFPSLGLQCPVSSNMAGKYEPNQK